MLILSTALAIGHVRKTSASCSLVLSQTCARHGRFTRVVCVLLLLLAWCAGFKASHKISRGG